MSALLGVVVAGFLGSFLVSGEADVPPLDFMYGDVLCLLQTFSDLFPSCSDHCGKGARLCLYACAFVHRSREKVTSLQLTTSPCSTARIGFSLGLEKNPRVLLIYIF